MSTFPSVKARLTYCAHTFKAVTRQHHEALIPLFTRYIPQDGVVIDVGAHAGQFTKLFSRLVPQGHVYAFEPGTYARSILQTVQAIKRMKNVTIIPVGLSDVPSVATLHIPIKKSGSLGFGLSSLGNVNDNGGNVHTDQVTLTTIDLFCAQNNVQRVDFIKADIEGWELHMLRGAAETLKRHRPVLMLEINEPALNGAGSSGAGVHELLAGLDYVAQSQGEDTLFIPREKQI